MQVIKILKSTLFLSFQAAESLKKDESVFFRIVRVSTPVVLYPDGIVILHMLFSG